jgi:hypothetical protein
MIATILLFASLFPATVVQLNAQDLPLFRTNRRNHREREFE